MARLTLKIGWLCWFASLGALLGGGSNTFFWALNISTFVLFGISIFINVVIWPMRR